MKSKKSNRHSKINEFQFNIKQFKFDAFRFVILLSIDRKHFSETTPIIIFDDDDATAKIGLLFKMTRNLEAPV